ncbi:MAG: group 1 truncated hemoglobin [Methylophilales bacterium 16-45-9]|nr:MAG: group 1 truncated hemoglobin [Methylophilales bacterium 16-45-9]
MIKLLTYLFIISLMSCAQQNANVQASSQATLFERIGGIPVLTVVVSETIDSAAQHPKLERTFKGIKLATLKESVVNQLCVLSGGDCKYEGETMKNSHADLKITTAEFELFVQAMRDSLNRHVATREKNELLKLLAPMKRDIVHQNN